jgi:Maltokinase N-terminal cap domain
MSDSTEPSGSVRCTAAQSRVLAAGERLSCDDVGMAVLHRATLVPSKGDLVAAWLPRRPWAPASGISSGVSYRLDDPAGQVGMEGFLLTDANGDTVHVPLSYREQPLDGAEEHLLGTMQHSVLGTRWAYDGCGDPVWAATLASTILTGGTQADELVDVGDALERRDPQVKVVGSGEPGTPVPTIGAVRTSESEFATTISTEGVELVVVRRVGTDPGCAHTLTATWGVSHRRVVLAGLRLR